MISALVIVANLGVSRDGAAERTWSRSQLLRIADDEAQRLGYDTEHMSVSFDVYNSQWKDYLRALEGIGGIPEVEEELDGHRYWAVYYSLLRRGTRGGDLWVFIDYDTGKIITSIRGQ